jgi:hypothetical protein
MTNEIAIRREITPSVWEMVRQMAPVMYNSRLFGVSSADAAAATLLKGMELGFGPAASFEFIQVIHGKPQLIPRGALAILHGSPLIEKITVTAIKDATGVYIGHECTIKRKNGFEYTARFTLADAQRAGLIKSGGAWEAYPQNMCLWRAVGFAADVAAPDLTAGATMLMKAPERWNVGLTETGDVIEGQVTPVARESLLDRMVVDLGPDKILEANGGNMPTTDDEVKALAAKLFYEIPF